MSKREKRYLVLIVLFMLISVALETLSIGAIFPFIAIILNSSISSQQPFMNRILTFGRDHFGDHFIIVMGLGLLLIFLIKNIFLYYFVSFQNKSIFRNTSTGQTHLYHSYLKAPYFFHLNTNTADLIRNVTSEVGIIFNNVLRTVLAIAVDVVLVASIILLLLFVSPQATAAAFVSLGLIAFFFNQLLKKSLKKYGAIRQGAISEMFKWINQGLGAIKEIKVLKRESYFVDRFAEATRVYARVEGNFNSLSQIPRLFFEVLAFAGILGIIITLSLLHRSGTEIISLIAMFSLAGMRLTPAFNRIMSNGANLQYYLPGLELISKEFERVNQIKKQNIPVSEIISHQRQGLRLENLTFRYPSSNKEAVKNINLIIGSTETIGIVGESGAGKTTLINIILGLIQPTQGAVFFNGLRYDEALESFGNFVSYVPQDIYLSDDTIKNNIAYGIPESEIDTTQVWRALQLAQLENFISESPQQLNAWVGERGVRISGGQKQRIGIARALYSNPQLLILDEPTSSLDSKTEKEIAEAIEEISKDKMVIVVTHRQGLLAQCNRIFRMHEGELTEIPNSSILTPPEALRKTEPYLMNSKVHL